MCAVVVMIIIILIKDKCNDIKLDKQKLKIYRSDDEILLNSLNYARPELSNLVREQSKVMKE